MLKLISKKNMLRIKRQTGKERKKPGGGGEGGGKRRK